MSLSDQSDRRFGMTYFQGKLYVGSDQGIYQYAAGRNDAYDIEHDQQTAKKTLIDTDGSVTGLAVDMPGGQVYATTDKALLRLNPVSLALSKVASGKGFAGLTMGRVFGSEASRGLLCSSPTLVVIAYLEFLLKHCGAIKLCRQRSTRHWLLV